MQSDNGNTHNYTNLLCRSVWNTLYLYLRGSDSSETLTVLYLLQDTVDFLHLFYFVKCCKADFSVFSCARLILCLHAACFLPLYRAYTDLGGIPVVEWWHKAGMSPVWVRLEASVPVSVSSVISGHLSFANHLTEAMQCPKHMVPTHLASSTTFIPASDRWASGACVTRVMWLQTRERLIKQVSLACARLHPQEYLQHHNTRTSCFPFNTRDTQSISIHRVWTNRQHVQIQVVQKQEYVLLLLVLHILALTAENIKPGSTVNNISTTRGSNSVTIIKQVSWKVTRQQPVRKLMCRNWWFYYSYW